MKQFIFIALLALVTTSVSLANVPRLMSYQGVLKNADGSYVDDGDYAITFRLYTAPEDGEAAWTETQTLPVSDGMFNAYLGNVTTLDLSFDVSYWLGISIGEDPELSPRIELAASPYTFRAAVADSALGTGGLYLPYSGAASGDSVSAFTIIALSPSGVAVRAMCGDPHETRGDLGSYQGGVVGSHTPSGNWGMIGTTDAGVLGGSDDGMGVYGSTESGVGVWGDHGDGGNLGQLGTANAGVEGFGGVPADWNVGQLGLPSEGVAGWSTDGTGVYGRTVFGQAVVGGHGDTENYGAIGTADAGVYGYSHTASSGVGVIGSSGGDGMGVSGETWSGEAVRGWHHDSGNHGMLGTAMGGVEGHCESPSGAGVYGESSVGHAGHFVGSVYVNGDVGIGTSTPARSLHVSDVLRLEPRADFPSDPTNGDLCVKETIGTYHIYCYLNGLWMQLD